MGRTGDALPLDAVLDFQLAHARAQDAVHTPLDAAALGFPVVFSAATDRATYLRRPDRGRTLAPGTALERGVWDAVFVLADGLSPLAVQRHALPLRAACLARLEGWRITTVTAVQARVALGDEIGAGLGAQQVAVLIGERPGLSVADSLGIYLTYDPRPGRRDSERNCISNIHPGGLSYATAADLLCWLMTEARHRKLTGTALKDDRAVPSAPETASLAAPTP